MHIETLKTFCDLVETGSLSRAARLNLVTQSAVSQQLRALEQRFGQRLIDRAPRLGAWPTEAGRLVYQEARELVDRLRALEEKLRAPGDAVTGTVRVGTVYSVGLHTLPAAMKKFLAAHPQVRVRLEYLRTDVVYQAVIDGQLDLGIVALPRRRPALEVVALRPDELVVVGPPDHPVVRRRTPTLPSLAGQPFIAFERDIPTRKLVDRLLREQGVVVAPVMELDNIETIKRSVEAGLGLSILPAPALAAEVRARTLVARRPAGGPFHRPIGVIRRRGRELSAAARAFLDRLERELGVRDTPP